MVVKEFDCLMRLKGIPRCVVLGPCNHASGLDPTQMTKSCDGTLDRICPFPAMKSRIFNADVPLESQRASCSTQRHLVHMMI